MNLEAIDKWHKTRVGHIFFGAIELGLAYVLASLAINSGSLWEYALAITFIVGGVLNFIKTFRHRKHE
jgi:uncharacterized membrane protein HdeD (DUF308 family)